MVDTQRMHEQLMEEVMDEVRASQSKVAASHDANSKDLANHLETAALLRAEVASAESAMDEARKQAEAATLAHEVRMHDRKRHVDICSRLFM